MGEFVFDIGALIEGLFLFWLNTSYSQFLWPCYAVIIVTVPDSYSTICHNVFEHEELWTLCKKFLKLVYRIRFIAIKNCKNYGIEQKCWLG